MGHSPDLEDTIEGAVLTLVDVNDLKNNLEEIKQSHDQLAAERAKLDPESMLVRRRRFQHNRG